MDLIDPIGHNSFELLYFVRTENDVKSCFLSGRNYLRCRGWKS